MANQHTTVRRIRNLIAKENFIARISWDNETHMFRLVYRWRDGIDRLTYVYFDEREYGGWYGRTEYKRALCWETYKGKVDYNTGNIDVFPAKDGILSDYSFKRSAYDLLRTSLLTYAARYTRPAYVGCKYTQDELDSMPGLWKDVK